MGLSSQINKENERALERALSNSELSKEEIEFILKKIKTIDFKGFELDILISVVNKLQNQWLVINNETASKKATT